MGNLGLSGPFVPQDACPSTTETSVITSHSVAGTIRGTATGSVSRFRYSTRLSGNQGFVSGRSGVLLRWLDKRSSARAQADKASYLTLCSPGAKPIFLEH